jgi:Zn-dependent protease
MSDIEDEIRRQVIAERTAQQNQQQPLPQPQNPANGYPPNPSSAQVPYYSQSQQPPVQPTNRPKSKLERWKDAGGFLGWLAGILLAIGKFVLPVVSVIAKLKYFGIAAKLFLMFGSMFLSIKVYSMMFGMRFAIGLVMLIFIHECGHALAAKMRGMKTGIMLFVPMMGAFVTTRGFGVNIVQDAFIGIMGPVVGTAASLLCAAMYIPTHDTFWLALGQWGCYVNLFNLLPTPPLDGGWITPLFSPKLL